DPGHHHHVAYCPCRVKRRRCVLMAPRRLPSTWDRTLQPSVPRPVKRALRTGYVAAGSLSSAGRLLPDFLVVGGQRCGTTSLFRALEQHPHIVRPTLNKGVNYFDI